ncbi:MAG: hypothetical protein RBS37_12700 [Bacteroidales bacterium]|jgi:hypothetical protein|nr:hypothetical protein [Bacteroidales bacterium]
MKKLVSPLLFVLLVLLPGCSLILYGPVRTYPDDFTGGSRHLLTRVVRPRELSTQIGSATMMFEKRVDDYNTKNTIYIVVSRSYGSFRSEENGYLKVNDTIFPLPLAYVTIERDYSVEDSDDKDDSEPTISGKLNEKFRLELTPEIVNAIVTGTSMEFRFYFGPEPATYRLKGSKLASVQRLLNK